VAWREGEATTEEFTAGGEAEAWLRMIGVFNKVSTEWIGYSGVCTATR
jgi:hypothetical protein